MNNMNINLSMGGPVGGVGGPMPMMNNGVPIPQPAQQQQQQQRHQSSVMDHRTVLNTYVYEYFLRNNMLECARAMVQSDVPIHYNTQKDESDVNGMGTDPMDTDSKDQKLAGDLPEPAVPTLQNADGCFLYEWFCLFWEMFSAQRGKSNHGQVAQYINHTQAQSRQKQNQQQEMLRNIRPDQFAMMRNMNNGAAMLKQNSLARAAMANNQNPNAMMIQAKQNQMARDPSDMDGNRQRPGSPGSTENAPSPSKRPRLDPPQGFNPNQPGMMPNGRPAQGAPGQQVGSGPNGGNHAQLMQMLLSYGITPASLTPQQFQTFANQPPMAQAKSIQAYAQNLSQHHGAQMPNKQMPNPGGPQGQGSPMMAQGPDGATLNAYYNPNEMSAAGGMRPGPGGAQAGGGSNHALQDYQMQLMLLEQQNKKRLMMARQEQDNQPNSMPRTDGPPGPPGPPGQVANGQPFPAGERAAGSPNPADQMKRGTPQMNNASIPSPLPENQSRGSPNAMNFIPNQMDPNLAPHFYKPGMDGNMPMNGGPMRPPSSHPNQQQFNGQQQMMAARQQQGQPGAPGGPGMQWPPQGGPQGGPQGPPQGPQSGPQGPRPVQNAPTGAMPPPAAPPAANNVANARNATSSPQQGTAQPPTPSQSSKPNPKKKDSKSTKDKRAATQKKAANHNASATPAAENTQGDEPPTPVTPSVNNFAAGKGNQPAPTAQPIPNGQTSAAPPAPAQVAPQPGQDPNQGGATFLDSNMNTEFNMPFADPLATNDVLDSFDFESFLHDEDGNVGSFDFNASFGGMEAEINVD